MKPAQLQRLFALMREYTDKIHELSCVADPIEARFEAYLSIVRPLYDLAVEVNNGHMDQLDRAELGLRLAEMQRWFK